MLYEVITPPSHRAKFLAGSWDTMGALLSNAKAATATASRIPYLALAAGKRP